MSLKYVFPQAVQRHGRTHRNHRHPNGERPPAHANAAWANSTPARRVEPLTFLEYRGTMSRSLMRHFGATVKIFQLSATVLILACTCLGQNWTNANLARPYSMHFSTPRTYTWSATFSCPANPTVALRVTGSATTTTNLSGVFSFDGKGNYTLNYTSYGNIDHAATIATMSVRWNSACHAPKLTMEPLHTSRQRRTRPLGHIQSILMAQVHFSGPTEFQ